MAMAWSESEREILRLVLDALIPPSADGRIPSGGLPEVVAFLAAAERYADAPVASVRRLLDCLRKQGGEEFAALSDGERVAALERVEAAAGEDFTTLTRLAYMGYYSRADVRRALGLNAAPAHPGGYEVAPDGEERLAELTAPVRERGRAYREA